MHFQKGSNLAKGHEPSRKGLARHEGGHQQSDRQDCARLDREISPSRTKVFRLGQDRHESEQGSIGNREEKHDRGGCHSRRFDQSSDFAPPGAFD